MEEPLQEYKFDSVNHIHTYCDKPLLGTSTVVNVIAKPLTWWASGLAVEKLGWSNSKLVPKDARLLMAQNRLEEIKEMDNERYLDLLDEAYKAHSVKLKDSAETGTDMHEMMEKYVKKCMLENEGKPMAIPSEDKKLQDFIEWSINKVKKFLWSELYCYSNILWVGGISDLGVELLNGEIGIIDFKSSKDAYESQFIQCAGYDLQITENGGFTEKGYPIFKLEKPITFYGIIPFGAEGFKVEERYNIEQLQKCFKACVEIHKLINK